MKGSVIALVALTFANLGQAHRNPHAPKYAPPYSPTSYVWTCECKGKLICKDGDRFSAKHCVSSNQVCDGVLDCKDGSDEASCTKVFTCPGGHYKCEIEDKCIRIDQVCDKKPDCLHGDDEATCPFTCPDGQYKCGGEERCIRIDQVCDKKQDCLTNGDDEASCEIRCSEGEYKCKGSEKCIAVGMVCDGNQTCPNGDDESDCLLRCSEGEYKCNGSEKCVAAGMVCDGNLDCPEEDDESDCLLRCSEGEYKCNGSEKCVAAGMVCDGNLDCPEGDDEADCACGACGFYRCKDAKTCLSIEKVCDNSTDCPDSDDELSCVSCNDTWKLVATTSSSGDVTQGSKQDLIDAVLAGAEIRILVPSIGYLTSVQNACKIGDNVCAQALLHISKAGFDMFQNNVYWWFLNACTTGNVDVSRYSVGSDNLVSRSTSKWEVKWFIRPMQNMPLMHTSGNNVVSGSLEELICHVKAGSDVRIVSECDGCAAPMDSLEISTNEDYVVGQSVYHVSQEENLPNLVFQNNPYWEFTNYITEAEVKHTRWTVGEHVNRGDISLKSQMAWHTESCWQVAYKHDASGNQLEGSLESLRSAILSGQRVKVIYGDTVSVEPDEVIICGDHIGAVILRMIKKDATDPRMFVSGAQWDWRVLSTTGAENTLSINVGENNEQERTTGTRGVCWYIEKRPWVPVLVNADSGAVQSGSKPDLIAAVNSGARIRYSFAPNPDTIIIHEADNLAISGNEVGAMHVRSVGVEKVPGSNTDWRFKPDAVYCFMIASTTGKVDSSKWTVGEHTSISHTQSTAEMNWFANF